MLHESRRHFHTSPSPHSDELLSDPCSSLNTQRFCFFPGMVFSPEICSLAPRFHLGLNLNFPFTERSFLNVLSQIEIAHIPTLPVPVAYLSFLLTHIAMENVINSTDFISFIFCLLMYTEIFVYFFHCCILSI